ncbi:MULTISPECIES: hypothetical protein [unclassified Wolbachia]|nr:MULTISPECIES: hypothetical protein [unclassified Wolbachia]
MSGHLDDTILFSGFRTGMTPSWMETSVSYLNDEKGATRMTPS